MDEGPRVGRPVYYGFVGMLMLTWALVPPLVLAAVLFRRWRLLWWLPAIVVADLALGALGAAALWELPDVASVQAPEGLARVSFPASSVRGHAGPAPARPATGWG